MTKMFEVDIYLKKITDQLAKTNSRLANSRNFANSRQHLTNSNWKKIHLPEGKGWGGEAKNDDPSRRSQ
jgi:hypothetical protein